MHIYKKVIRIDNLREALRQTQRYASRGIGSALSRVLVASAIQPVNLTIR